MRYEQLSFFDVKAEPIDLICDYLEEAYYRHKTDPEEREAYDCETDSFIILPVLPFDQWVRDNFKRPNGLHWPGNHKPYNGVDFSPEGAILCMNDGSTEFVSKQRIYSRLGITKEKQP